MLKGTITILNKSNTSIYYNVPHRRADHTGELITLPRPYHIPAQNTTVLCYRLYNLCCTVYRSIQKVLLLLVLHVRELCPVSLHRPQRLWVEPLRIITRTRSLPSSHHYALANSFRVVSLTPSSSSKGTLPSVSCFLLYATYVAWRPSLAA